MILSVNFLDLDGKWRERRFDCGGFRVLECGALEIRNDDGDPGLMGFQYWKRWPKEATVRVVIAHGCWQIAGEVAP